MSKWISHQIIQYLNEKYANIEAKDVREHEVRKKNIEASNIRTQTPLHIACLNGHLQVVNYHIEKLFQ